MEKLENEFNDMMKSLKETIKNRSITEFNSLKNNKKPLQWDLQFNLKNAISLIIPRFEDYSNLDLYVPIHNNKEIILFNIATHEISKIENPLLDTFLFNIIFINQNIYLLGGCSNSGLAKN